MDQITLRTKVLESLEKGLQAKSKTLKTEMKLIELRHLAERPALSIPGVANTLSHILLLAKFLCMKHPLLADELINQYREQKYFTWTPKDSSGLRKMIDSCGEELTPDLPLQLIELYNNQLKDSKMTIAKLRAQQSTNLDDARKCLKSLKRLKHELALVTLLTNFPMVPFFAKLATTLPQIYYLPFTDNVELQMLFDERISYKIRKLKVKQNYKKVLSELKIVFKTSKMYTFNQYNNTKDETHKIIEEVYLNDFAKKVINVHGTYIGFETENYLKHFHIISLIFRLWRNFISPILIVSNSNAFNEWNVTNESNFMKMEAQEESMNSNQFTVQQCKEDALANGEKRKREEESEECKQMKFMHESFSPRVFTIRTKNDCELFAEQADFILRSYANTLVVVSPFLVSAIPSASKFGCVIVDMEDNDISLQSDRHNDSILNNSSSCNVGKLFLQLQCFRPKSVVFMIKTETKADVLEQTIHSMVNLRIIDKNAITENVNVLIDEQSHDIFAKRFDIIPTLSLLQKVLIQCLCFAKKSSQSSQNVSQKIMKILLHPLLLQKHNWELNERTINESGLLRVLDLTFTFLQRQNKRVLIVANRNERYLIASLAEFRNQPTMSISESGLTKEQYDKWSTGCYFALLTPYYSSSIIALEGVDFIALVHPQWCVTQMVRAERAVASIVRENKSIPVLRLFAPRCLTERNFCQQVNERRIDALSELSRVLTSGVNDDIRSLETLFDEKNLGVIKEESSNTIDKAARILLGDVVERLNEFVVGDIVERRILI